MTKCEQAQKGVDLLIDQIEDLCALALDDKETIKNSVFEQQVKSFAGKKGEKQKSLSIQIRITLVQALRCMRHYSIHLGGFEKPNDELQRISYSEEKEGIELDEEEKALDDKRVDEELEVLGSIGFKNAKEPYVKFPDAISKVDDMCKQLCQQLYTGENLKYLEGSDKIPQYLSIFLEHMKKQAEEFKIQQVRQLRTSAGRLQALAQEIPKSVFHYLNLRFKSKIEDLVNKETDKFKNAKEADDATKSNHLKLFRPNLANPANKAATQELNEQERKRTEEFIQVSLN